MKNKSRGWYFGEIHEKHSWGLYIGEKPETNAAKMRWVGQVNKNSKNKLDELDLNLDLRVRVGENLPWYAAILGGLPAVAGSAVINEIFEEDINNLTNYQYEVLGTISEPKLERVKQEIK